MTQEALKLALDALENHTAIKHPQQIHYRDKAITAIKEALTQEKTLAALHAENDRLGLYKDAYAQPEQEPVAWRFTGIAGLNRYMTQKKYDAQTPEIKKWYEPFKCANCITLPQRTEQEPVAWELGVINGVVTRRPIALPQRTWVGLTDEDRYEFAAAQYGWEELLIAAEAKLKDKNCVG